MKKSITYALSALVLLVVAALLFGLYHTTRPATAEGEKHIEVTVVHGSGEEKHFHYQTDELYLGALLLSEGLIKGEDGPYGLYIKEVDGEVADFATNGAYWALYEGESYATQGIDTTVLTDGGQFALVYTYG